jgi:hypothetical protein
MAWFHPIICRELAPEVGLESGVHFGHGHVAGKELAKDVPGIRIIKC